MRLACCAVVTCVLAMVATPALAAPVLSITDACAYPGSQFALSGSGFEPNQRASVEVMSSADPIAGAPISTRAVTADAGGRLIALLDVPATDATGMTDRSVRARPDPDGALGVPTVLAATPLRTASRGISVLPAAQEGVAGGTERWRVTGLPEGTRMTAHYRHGGKTVTSVDVGVATEPCGRLRFDLRTLPRRHERSGEWDVWLTAKRVFRVPRQGVYAKRAMTADGDGPRARVRFGALRFRLEASDPRAVAPVTSAFAADASRIGVISLDFVGAGGAPVDFFERIGDRLKPLGRVQAPPTEHTILSDATTWSCSRLTRRFVASTTLPDGTTASGAHAVRTPSCAGRFRISVPRRVRAGGTIAVRVVDRWGNGAITPRLCVKAPGRDESCRSLAFARAVAIATRSVRADRRGTWRLILRGAGSQARTSVEVGGDGAVAKAAPALLATGDSLMQGIDSFLEQRLGSAARVRSDVRPGTGISKPGTDWTQIAAEQAAGVKPKTTVISIGAADGFAMTPAQGATIECCGEPWIAEYARRVGAMLQTYLQGGRGRVYWLTLPLPRSPGRLEITNAVNSAIERASTGVAGVTVVRLDLLFSPGGYSDTIRYRGRTVNVREIDGIHLNVAGTAIAADVIAELIRHDR